MGNSRQQLEAVLNHYGVRYRDRVGNQDVRCPSEGAHKRGDRMASMSVHLDKGVANCKACGLAGGAVEIVMAIEGAGRFEAVARIAGFAGERGEQVPDARREGGILPRGARSMAPRDPGEVPAWRRGRGRAA